MIVVDASALVETPLRTPISEAMEDRLFALFQTLHVADLIDVEVTQVIRHYVANGAVDGPDGDLAVTDLAALRM